MLLYVPYFKFFVFAIVNYCYFVTFQKFELVKEIDTNNTRPFAMGAIQDKVFVGFGNCAQMYNKVFLSLILLLLYVLIVYYKDFELVKQFPDFSMSFLPIDNTMWIGGEGNIRVISMVISILFSCS